MKRGRHLLRRATLLLRPDRNWRAVLVGAGDHEDAVAGDAVVAGEDVGRQIGAGDLAQVQRSIGIRPGDADKYGFRHRITHPYKRHSNPLRRTGATGAPIPPADGQAGRAGLADEGGDGAPLTPPPPSPPPNSGGGGASP